MTTREEISRWFDLGAERGSKYMLVMCDTFDHEDYPNYAASDEECLATYKAPGEMQRVMEVYNLTEPKEPQLNERRCKRLPAVTGAQPAPAAPNGAMTDENAGQMIADMLMECAKRLGNFPLADVDRRAWRHLLVYAPAAQPADSAMAVNAKRYEFLRDRLLAADFDWNESGQCVLVFKWPENVAVSADCDDNIDRALAAFDALENK
jgi:hypothetical protein